MSIRKKMKIQIENKEIESFKMFCLILKYDVITGGSKSSELNQ